MTNVQLIQMLETLRSSNIFRDRTDYEHYNAFVDLSLKNIGNNLYYYPYGELSTEEIRIGLNQGKLACVKAYKDRTNESLLDSKHTVEKYFERNNMKFGQTN